MRRPSPYPARYRATRTLDLPSGYRTEVHILCDIDPGEAGNWSGPPDTWSPDVPPTVEVVQATAELDPDEIEERLGLHVKRAWALVDPEVIEAALGPDGLDDIYMEYEEARRAAEEDWRVWQAEQAEQMGPSDGLDGLAA